MNRKFAFPTNAAGLEGITLTGSDAEKSLVLHLRLSGQDWLIPCGYQDWKKSRAPLLAGKLAHFPDEPIAATFAWLADDTCAVKICAYETPYHKTLTLKFAGDQVTLNSELNVAFEAATHRTLTGHAD
jgi:hypothetical protein